MHQQSHEDYVVVYPLPFQLLFRLLHLEEHLVVLQVKLKALKEFHQNFLANLQFLGPALEEENVHMDLIDILYTSGHHRI